MTAPTPTTAPTAAEREGAQPQVDRWRDTLTGEGVDTILARAWDCYVRDNTSALDARYAARDARSVALYLRAALLAARRENETLHFSAWRAEDERIRLDQEVRDLRTALDATRAALAATQEET